MTLPFKERLAQQLTTQTIGHTLHHFAQLNSTNAFALDRAKAGASHGEVFLSDQQSQGRGRLDRTWYSPRGGLYLSILLKPQCSPREIPRLTLVAGAACSEALSKLTGQPIALKWPNDLHYQGKKLGGILSEAEFKGSTVLCAVIGIGVNLQLDRTALPSELQDIAISLTEIDQHAWERSAVAAALLNHFETWYQKFAAGQWPAIVAWCDTHNVLKGRQVTLSIGDKSVTGLATGLDSEGHLMLRLASGEERHYLAGDTTLA